MALEKRTVSINFASGLDQGTDDKLTAKLTTADNVVFRRNGTIEKRPGYVTDMTWSASANPARIFPFNDSHFTISDWSTDTSATGVNMIIGLDGLYTDSYKCQTIVSKIGGKSITSDTKPFAFVETQPLYEGTLDNGQLAFAVFGASATGTGIAYLRSSMTTGSGVSIFSAVDIDTRESLKPPVFGTGLTKLKVRACAPSNTSVTVYTLNASGTTVAISSYFSGSMTEAVKATFNMSASVTTNNNSADMVAIGGNLYFCYRNIGTTAVVVGKYDPVANTTVTNSFNTSITPDIMTIATPQDNTDRFRIFWGANGSSTVMYASYSLTVSQIRAPVGLISATAYSSTMNQIEAVENFGATSACVYVTKQAPSAGFPVATFYAGAVSNTDVALFMHGDSFAMGATLASKPFISNQQPHLVVNYDSTANQAIYVLRHATLYSEDQIYTGFIPAARSLFGLSGGGALHVRDWLPSVVKIDSDNFYTATRKAVSFRAQNGTITTNYGTDLVKINLSQTFPIPYASAGGNSFLGGGYLSEYDGEGVFECGFLGAPSIFTVSITTTGGFIGSTAGSATYSMVACEEWTDKTGRTHRSSPSLPYTFNISTTTSKATPSVYTSPSIKRLTRPGTRIAIFRTAANGSIYYRDPSSVQSSVTIPPLNAVLIGYYNIALTASDASLSGSDIIYTQGGSLPNWTPGGASAICSRGQRIFCNDANDQDSVIYSKELIPGEAVAFSQQNKIPIPSNGSKITALSDMDSNLIVFKKRSIYVVSGDGPDDTGTVGTFSEGQLLFSDVGCVDQRNLCRISAGVVFKSPDKGWFLLTRDLQLQPIGDDVQDYNGKTVISSEVINTTDENGSVEECRFLCSDGTLLTFNYSNGQWSTATLSGCADAISTGGKYIVVNTSSTAASARVFQESISTYLDAFSNTSATYQMTVETGWIKTADIQGFQRIWKARVLGDSYTGGGGSIVAEVAYDYEQSYNEAHTFTISSLTVANFTGGPVASPQLEIRLARQKCQAIRFRIKDYPTPGTTHGGVMRLTNLSLDCGVKSGGFRLPASKVG